MILFLKRAIRDILTNKFLNAVTIVTIAFSVLIVSAFVLFFINASSIMNFWAKGIRIMVYLEPNIPKNNISGIQHEIEGMQGVLDVRFISKEEALKWFKKQMKKHAPLVDNLNENPLPDAFEILLEESLRNWENFEALAMQIETMSFVEEVEYGRKWLGQFTNIVSLFRLTGYAMGCLLFMAAVFFVANTIRLALYSRLEEVEIMRLVGATESFIKTPFYIQGIVQGAVGGIIGLGSLFVAFKFMVGNWKFEPENMSFGNDSSFQFLISNFHIKYLSPEIFFTILLGSIFLGWLGCYLSLKQFLKF